METNRQKKIGALLQNDLVDILQGEVRKNGMTNLIISVSKVNVTSDLSIAKVFFASLVLAPSTFQSTKSQNGTQSRTEMLPETFVQQKQKD